MTQKPTAIAPKTVPARRYRVTAEDAGQRLDNLLIRLLPGVPRSRIYRMLRGGEVRLNSRRVKATQRVEAQQEVRLPPVFLQERRPAVGSKSLITALEQAVLYEDDDYLVIDKPAGVAVHGGSGVAGAVLETLRAGRELPGLELVHRIDRETSGCLALAKRRSALRRAHQQLRDGEVDKRYVAIVHGSWPPRADIDLPLLRRERGGERFMQVARNDANAQQAHTRVVSVAHGPTLSRLEVKPITGRTHQIRVHLAYCGHPIVGDEKYGDADLDAKSAATRMYLHASRLVLGSIAVEAPLPPAFGKLWTARDRPARESD